MRLSSVLRNLKNVTEGNDNFDKNQILNIHYSRKVTKEETLLVNKI